MENINIEEISLELDELVVEELETRLEMAACSGSGISCNAN